MSAIRNFALVAIAAAALSGSAQAQGQAIHRQGRHGEMGVFRNLNLTEAQKTQIKAIHAKYQTQLEASRSQAKPYLDAARAARQKGDTAGARANLEKARQVSSGVRQQEMNEIRGILTPAQRAQADSAIARGRNGQAWGAGRGAMKGGRDGRAAAFKSLNLTDAQKSQIKAIRAKYKGQATATREQEMNEIRAVLTADQRAKLDSEIAQRKQHEGNRGAHRGGLRKAGAKRGS